jgi:hypothetical protein
VYFEESSVVLVARKKRLKQTEREIMQRNILPVEHVDCAFGVILCGEDYGAETPRAAVLAKSYIRTEDGTGLTK